ncbi:NAD-dependent epimerase/dehydratase family protein [Pedobacter nototheniae]|uniref:NAD-dependent epimerase/dehydratase family protein n=1 Tax=Pedobacter nototheniae TaxID=2488994 RepID=UPI001478885C|nr:NAD-dependent epimerase/dehydratase family protein [Pedobacter nototheniae]
MITLITGGTGFVGGNFRSFLEDFAIDFRLANRDSLSNINTLDVNGIDAIVHLAGKAHDLKAVSNGEEYYQVNYENTKKLYDAFLSSNAEKFVFISSVKAVADVVEKVLTEETNPNPQTHYGKSKLMAEEYIQNQPLPVGKSYYILRPCMIHGPGNKGNLNLLYKFVRKGIPYPLGAFKNKRSFLSVDNLCFIIKELLLNNVESGVYNVADDEALSTNEVVRILSESIDKPAKIWAIPDGFLRTLAKVGDILKLPLNTERLNKLTENYVVSNKKIKTVLDISLPLSAKDGLIITAKSFTKD